MALTIVTTLPADSDTSSAVQLTGTALRVSARVTTGGPATLALIRMNSTGKWYRATDAFGNYNEIVLTGKGNAGPTGTGLSGNTDWSFTLPAVGSNEWYGLLLDGGTTFSGTAELISISAPAAAGGTVPSGRALTMGSGLLIAGTTSADLSADRTIALDSTMWAITASALTMAANVDVLCAAGTSKLDFSLGTGIFKTPSGAGTLSGTTNIAANKNLTCSAGTTALDLSLGTGDWKPPTGAGTWAGASGKALSLVATAAAITITADAASVWKTTIGALTVDAAAALQLGTTAATSIAMGNGSIAVAITSAGASSLVVGANGATNPALKIDSSTATSVTGLQVKSAASGAGVAVAAISSAGAENLTIAAKGTTGTVTINPGIAIPAAGSAAGSILIGATAAFGLYIGSGAPTVAAAKGSLYLRSDGSSSSTRLYSASDSAGTWVAVTTAS